MEKKVVIFIGRSGCGKGTQVNLLMEKFKALDSKNDIFYLETGAKFREFITLPNYTSILSRGVMDRQDRQPDFLAVHIWSHILIESMNGNQHVFFDGTPRSYTEALTLDTAMKFYDFKKPFIVYLNISRETAEARLRSRGREDDTNDHDIAKRLDWFDKDVMPAIQYYQNNSDYQFLDIDGERTVEEIHADLVDKILRNVDHN